MNHSTEAEVEVQAHSVELRRRAIQLVRENGRSVAEVALDLDVSATTVRRWLTIADHEHAGSRPARSRRPDSPLRQELDQMRRQIRGLELEVELLKWMAVKMAEPTNGRRVSR
jgi:transposase